MGHNHDKHHSQSHNHGEELFEVGCSCGQGSCSGEGEEKSKVPRLIFGAVFFAAAIALKNFELGTDLIFQSSFKGIAAISPVFFVFLAAFLLIGYDIIWSAVRNILRGQVFDENFLMCVAAIGAFLIGEYPEAVAVMLFYQVGEQFQDYAVDRSKKSIAGLMDIRPDSANVKRGDSFVTISPEALIIGDIIQIRPGERVPVDSHIISGNSTVDTSALTGESLPRDVEVGSPLISGCVNISGLVEAEVDQLFSQSTVTKILDLVQNASSKKSKSENFITKFARYYTPVVVLAAALLAIVPPLVTGGAFHDWIYRALLFLVVSCPCALVISVPLSFFGGIGGASKHGILVKGGNYLEALSRVDTVVFDKTGTLTKGAFTVSAIHAENMEDKELLDIAAHAEAFSSHPISMSLRAAHGQTIDEAKVIDVQEIAGQGIKATVDGKQVLAGNAKLMTAAGLADDLKTAYSEIGTVVHVAVSGKYAGYIVISDEIKSDSKNAIRSLKEAGVKKTVMLTGDAKAVADQVGSALEIDEIFSELLPAGKVDIAEKLLSEKPVKSTLVFVGDGINDAPVLARADVGIAMGGVGSDAAIEAADVVIMTDEPSKVASAIKIAKATIAIANQNIVFALGVKVIVLALGALGIATMWEAIFADVGVSVIAILNAIRALNAKA